MSELIRMGGSIVIIVLVLELLDFPQWVGEKLKGDRFRKDTGQKIAELEQRILELENERKSG
mgnify:CR=1 FL=1